MLSWYSSFHIFFAALLNIFYLSLSLRVHHAYIHILVPDHVLLKLNCTVLIFEETIATALFQFDEKSYETFYKIVLKLLHALARSNYSCAGCCRIRVPSPWASRVSSSFSSFFFFTFLLRWWWAVVGWGFVWSHHLANSLLYILLAIEHANQAPLLKR